MARDALLKEFSFTVDLKRTLPLPDIEVVEGDTGSVLKVSVTDDGEAVSLQGMLVTAVFASSAGTAVQDSDNGGITLNGNTAEIELYPASIAPGHVSCELQLYSSSEENPESRDDYDVLVTTARFGFDCREAMLNDEAVAALPETPLLMALLESVSQAEAAREAAEQQRETAFAAMLANAGAGGGCLTGAGAPSSSAVASAGMLYFDTVNQNVYVCTDDSDGTEWAMLLFADGTANDLKVTRNATYTFAEVPSSLPITLQELVCRLSGWYSEINGKQAALTFDSSPTANSTNPVTSGGVYLAQHARDWVTIADSTLAEDVSSVTISSYDSLHGSGGFQFDELRLFMIGSLYFNAAMRVFVNGEQQKYIRFQVFTFVTPEAPDECFAKLMLHKPVNGFAIAERSYGGDSDDGGYSNGSAVQATMLKHSGLTNYTSVKLAVDNVSARIPTGTRIVLQGRNLV